MKLRDRFGSRDSYSSASASSDRRSSGSVKLLAIRRQRLIWSSIANVSVINHVAYVAPATLTQRCALTVVPESGRNPGFSYADFMNPPDRPSVGAREEILICMNHISSPAANRKGVNRSLAASFLF